MIDKDKKYETIFRGPLESNKYPKGIYTLVFDRAENSIVKKLIIDKVFLFFFFD